MQSISPLLRSPFHSLLAFARYFGFGGIRLRETPRLPNKTDSADRYHVSGQAVVTLAGKDFYLGKHDTPESRARYHALLAEYNGNGLQAPEQLTHQVDVPITVSCVTARR